MRFYTNPAMRFYTNPSRESDPYALPDAEVFYADAGEMPSDDEGPSEAGWYVWACFQGRMPDSYAWGPYPTAKAAIKAWRDANEDWDEDASEDNSKEGV